MVLTGFLVLQAVAQDHGVAVVLGLLPLKEDFSVRLFSHFWGIRCRWWSSQHNSHTSDSLSDLQRKYQLCTKRRLFQ